MLLTLLNNQRKKNEKNSVHKRLRFLIQIFFRFRAQDEKNIYDLPY